MYVKPEATITVYELLMMGGVSPETCWAIKKHWNNKFYYTVGSCWFFLWDLGEASCCCTWSHPLTHTHTHTYTRTHIHAHTYTHTVGETPLEEGSARRKGLYLHNTQHLQQTNVHDPSGMRTCSTSNRAAAGLCSRSRRHRHRQIYIQ